MKMNRKKRRSLFALISKRYRQKNNSRLRNSSGFSK